MKVEIRPAEGGEDAVQFAHELLGAFLKYVARVGGSASSVEQNDRGATFRVAGANVHDYAGTHRVQHIPRGAQKRHTSTAVVVVTDDQTASIPSLNPKDVRIDFYRASGNGGQKRNVTDSAVRAVHLPTGLTATAERERSQSQNRAVALRILDEKLTERTLTATRNAVHAGRDRRLNDRRDAKHFTWNEQRGEVLEHGSGRRWRINDFVRGKFDR